MATIQNIEERLDRLNHTPVKPIVVKTGGGVDCRLVNDLRRPIGGVLLCDKWLEFVKGLEEALEATVEG